MPAESVEDLAGFFDAADHAAAAAWTLAGGAQSWPVNVILDLPDELAGGGTGVRLPSAVARCAVARLPVGYGKGDKLVVDGVTYTVERVDLDQTRTLASVNLRAA